jgi:hypothetical protein
MKSDANQIMFSEFKNGTYAVCNKFAGEYFAGNPDSGRLAVVGLSIVEL